MNIQAIDVFSLDGFDNGIPHDVFSFLRNEAPVYRHPDPVLPEGFWAVTRHRDVVFISRNPDIFSSHERTAMIDEYTPEELAHEQVSLINLDPPDHTRLRSLVNRGFTPRMVGRLREGMQASCQRIVDEALAKGEIDAVADVAADLPLIVIADLLGVPQGDRDKLFDWSNGVVGADDPDIGTGPESGAEARLGIYSYARNLGNQKRACPADDIVSKFVTKDEHGNQLSELEFERFFLLLAVAGNETTRNAISGGVQAFIDHPEQWRRVKDDPSLVAPAADEIVRWVTPVIDFRRTVMRDVELGGVQLRKGDKVLIYYASANRDESVFNDPFAFDVGRNPNPHVGFGGGGPHFCLGRHLALLEIQIMFETLVRRVDRFEPLGPPARMRSHLINGLKALPVRLVPAAS
jgi:cholest-4-en-3-one 26-monooxygenase